MIGGFVVGLFGELAGGLLRDGGAGAAAGVVLEQLTRASLAGGLFAAAVWCLVRALPRLGPGWRSALWWAASLELVAALLWVVPLELALLPASWGPAESGAVAAVPAVLSRDAAAAASSPAPPVAGAAAGPASPVGEPPAGAPAAGPVPAFPWRQGLAALWLLGLAAGALGVARELAAARRLRRQSAPATDPDLLAAFAELRGRLGVRRPVELRLSAAVGSPLTLGPVRPAVVLPARAGEELRGEELALALGHELLHVRRRDLWTGWLPAIARRLFFFHPLAALAAREYHLAREAACDAAVVRELGASPRAYGRLLVRWGSSPLHRAAPGGAAAAGAPGGLPGGLPGIGAAAAASPSFLDLKRRLVMLHNPTSPSRGLEAFAWAAAVLAVAVLVPLRIVAEPPAPPAPPAAVAAPEAPEAPEAPSVRLAAAAPEAPAPPVVPDAPRAPAPPRAPEHSSGTVWSDGGNGREAWALIEGDSSVWMHGSSSDHRRFRQLRSVDGGTVLWFRRDGAEYVVRDAETIARAKAILEPQRELGREQGQLGARQAELGARQAELGERQAELGRRQGELGMRQGELGAQQGALGAEQARLGAEQAALAAERAALDARRAADRDAGEDAAYSARRDELEARRAELSARMRELGERQRELGERQRELGVPQAELGERQRELGVPQRELGERQRELGELQRRLGERQRAEAEKAEPLLRELFDRAIERGLAERAD
jgi:bla regulator protein BlaR1